MQAIEKWPLLARLQFAPLMAARATFALNAGLWFRRARFVIVSLLIRSHPGRCQAETPLIRLLKFAEPALYDEQVDSTAQALAWSKQSPTTGIIEYTRMLCERNRIN
jgi:hypothetical protein